MPRGADPAAARAAIRLLVLMRRRGDITALSPVAVTPDELGSSELAVELDGAPVAYLHRTPDLAALVARAARDRALAAGCLVADEWIVESSNTPRIEIRDAAHRTIFGAIGKPRRSAAVTDRLVAHFRAMARNNAWANDRLLDACEGLDAAAFAAPRTSFFPSLRRTLNHLYAVDVYYLDALEETGRGLAIFQPADPDFAEPAALRAAQAASDRRLLAFCDRLQAPDLDRRVKSTAATRASSPSASTRSSPTSSSTKSTTAARPTPCSPAPPSRRPSSTNSSSTTTATPAASRGRAPQPPPRPSSLSGSAGVEGGRRGPPWATRGRRHEAAGRSLRPEAEPANAGERRSKRRLRPQSRGTWPALSGRARAAATRAPARSAPPPPRRGRAPWRG